MLSRSYPQNTDLRIGIPNMVIDELNGWLMNSMVGFPIQYLIHSNELRCMHGRRSLGRGLYPPLDGTNRVERSAREFEEIPSLAMSIEGHDPRREEEAPPREEMTKETPTNQGQRITMREYSLPAIRN
ncbi:hypothetical protein LWI29_028503 [Acer saccharum]|uniref:Uncharacterized protein n=1 Tax=Acer saccharum TaxID=4024 RepID=A0AA39VHB1_ACESA|nr:hypothetical protein LWI29_028503 [Acer saccharum]